MEVDIKKLALLARIELTGNEEKRLKNEFEAILDYVSELKKADVKGVSNEEASKTTSLENVMRADEPRDELCEFSERLLKEVPETENGYVKVKRILE